MADIGTNAVIEFFELLVRIQKFLDANLDERTANLDTFPWFSQSFKENPDTIGVDHDNSFYSIQ
jgi:hypothetical protein